MLHVINVVLTTLLFAVGAMKKEGWERWGVDLHCGRSRVDSVNGLERVARFGNVAHGRQDIVRVKPR